MRERILARLHGAAGEYVSGEELAAELGVSRTAVWKRVAELKAAGYPIESCTRLGYRLPPGANALDAALFAGRCIRVEETDSTNRLARELWEAGAIGHGDVVVAARQTRGRGRRGRRWESPPGGLWFSLLLRPSLAPAQVAPFSLVCAVAVAEALQRFVPVPVQVKWPNDVLVGGRKAAGVLLEMQAEFDRIEYVIAGIGINVNLDREVFPAPLRGLVTSLQAEAGTPLPLETVLQEVLGGLQACFGEFVASGWPPFRRRFQRLCAHRGRLIRVCQGESWLEGIDEGVDADGCLRLRLVDGRLVRVAAGDVVFDSGLDAGEDECTSSG